MRSVRAFDLRTPTLDQSHWWRASAACVDAPLEMVDAAYTRSGGPDARAFIKQFCSGCPVRTECHQEAMTTGEFGVWGGQGQHARTKHGGRKPEVRSSL